MVPVVVTWSISGRIPLSNVRSPHSAAKPFVDVSVVCARVDDDNDSFGERTADQEASESFDRDLLELFSSLLQQNLFSCEFF